MSLCYPHILLDIQLSASALNVSSFCLFIHCLFLVIKKTSVSITSLAYQHYLKIFVGLLMQMLTGPPRHLRPGTSSSLWTVPVSLQACPAGQGTRCTAVAVKSLTGGWWRKMRLISLTCSSAGWEELQLPWVAGSGEPLLAAVSHSCLHPHSAYGCLDFHLWQERPPYLPVPKLLSTRLLLSSFPLLFNLMLQRGFPRVLVRQTPLIHTTKPREKAHGGWGLEKRPVGGDSSSSHFHATRFSARPQDRKALGSQAQERKVKSNDWLFLPTLQSLPLRAQMTAKSDPFQALSALLFPIYIVNSDGSEGYVHSLFHSFLCSRKLYGGELLLCARPHLSVRRTVAMEGQSLDLWVLRVSGRKCKYLSPFRKEALWWRGKAWVRATLPVGGNLTSASTRSAIWSLLLTFSVKWWESLYLI